MADSAIGLGSGGGGAGGGGIAFRTPRDIFNGATRTAAEALRDSTITDTTEWDDDPILGIILTWPVVVANTIYQVRRGGQWVDVDVLVEGDDGNDGSTGPVGPQSRIVLYAYINTATAPTAAPTGGTFVLSTGVKTVPAGYTRCRCNATLRPEDIQARGHRQSRCRFRHRQPCVVHPCRTSRLRRSGSSGGLCE